MSNATCRYMTGTATAGAQNRRWRAQFNGRTAASKARDRGSHIKAASYSYSVILEPQKGGGSTVLVRALPEVVTVGDTEQEALANAEEAIGAILAYSQEREVAPPSDAHPEIRHVTVAA